MDYDIIQGNDDDDNDNNSDDDDDDDDDDADDAVDDDQDSSYTLGKTSGELEVLCCWMRRLNIKWVLKNYVF